MEPQAFGTSTSIIAFLVIFLREDLAPNVATSLGTGQPLCVRFRLFLLPDSRHSMFAISQNLENLVSGMVLESCCATYSRGCRT